LRDGDDFRGLLSPHCGGKTLDRLVQFAELVEKWSGRHYLIHYADRRELVNRHMVDALAGVNLIPPAGRLVDVGSGAGFPAVPLLAACPGLSGLLLEPRQKRWAFLKLVVRELELDAEVVRVRYQDVEDAGPWSVVTTRAVANQPRIAEWARPRLASDGVVLLWTTEKTEATLTALAGWRMLSSRLPGLDRGRLIRLQPCFT